MWKVSAFLYDTLNVGVSSRLYAQVAYFGCQQGVIGGGWYFIVGRFVAVLCVVETEVLSRSSVSVNCASVGFILALTRMLLEVGCRSATKRGDVNGSFA